MQVHWDRKGKKKSISGKEQKNQPIFILLQAGISLWGQASGKASQSLWNGVRVIPEDFASACSGVTWGEHRGAGVCATAPTAFFALHWFPWILACLENPRKRSQLSCFPSTCSWLSWIYQEIPANWAPYTAVLCLAIKTEQLFLLPEYKVRGIRLGRSLVLEIVGQLAERLVRDMPVLETHILPASWVQSQLQALLHLTLLPLPIESFLEWGLSLIPQKWCLSDWRINLS